LEERVAIAALPTPPSPLAGAVPAIHALGGTMPTPPTTHAGLPLPPSPHAPAAGSLAPPAGVHPSPGPQYAMVNGQRVAGHWVTIHGHKIFISDQGTIHFGGPGTAPADPTSPGYAGDVQHELRRLGAFRSQHLSGNRHLLEHTQYTGHRVHMTYTGSGWRLELEHRPTGQIVQTKRLATRQKSQAVTEATRMIAEAHGQEIAQYAAHHLATVKAHQAAQAPGGAAATAPSLQQYHQQAVTFGPRQGNRIVATAKQSGATVEMVYVGRGWTLTLRDAQGRQIRRIAIQGRGTAYAQMVASMLLYAHEHGASIQIPTGPAPTGPGGAQAALQHAALLTGQQGSLPSAPSSQQPAPATSPAIQPAAAQPKPLNQPPPPPAQPATAPRILTDQDFAGMQVVPGQWLSQTAWNYLSYNTATNRSGGETHTLRYQHPNGAVIVAGGAHHPGRAKVYTTVALIDPQGRTIAEYSRTDSEHSIQARNAAAIAGHLLQHLANVATWYDQVYLPSLPPSLPPSSPVSAPATKAAPAPPDDATAPPGSAVYTPPPPRLIRAQPYVASRRAASLMTLPTAIDHTHVAGLADQPSSLSQDWWADLSGSALLYPAQLKHQPSGWSVVATWKGKPPASGQPGGYRIEILDQHGAIQSVYTSNADRTQDYVARRAVQVAHLLEQYLAARNQSPASHSAPIAQLAHYYQQQNAAAGQPRFQLDEKSWQDPKTHHAVKGYLSNLFPKLVGQPQHAPHGGLDPIEHSLNVIDPANLRTQGLDDRDAELLRLAMVFHDVGKQWDPYDHEHPRKSVVDAEPYLWHFGLTPQEHQLVSTIIKWHDAFGDYEQGRLSLQKVAAIAQDDRTAELLMRAFQSDVSAIPGFRGAIDVDRIGPRVLAALKQEIARQKAAGRLPPPDVPVPTPPAMQTTAPPPNLVAPGLRYGEIVQRATDVPVGDPTPYGATVEPPREVYDEAAQHPELNYARAFNMAYDGPTGRIVTVYHGTYDRPSVLQGITELGLKPGHHNAFGHGVYTVVNGHHTIPSGYANGAVVVCELHTGRTISHDDAVTLAMQWARQHPAEARRLSYEEQITAAALAAGYTTIAVDYSIGHPTLVVLDPARLRIKTITTNDGKRGLTVQLADGRVVSYRPATSSEISPQRGSPDYHDVLRSGRKVEPAGYRGHARTS
jgi:hypothetical protein